ncbi:hypothetical protein [Mycobacteroides abscessus]|uniref:hypothetical protein n=1 Tax=Mycobacteroides abscessus TaxID=36809 RepID=UPI0009CB7B43|nr:hypothetical protein [Mycobacteroides abscessus]SKS50604.1 Uncharacterised protein [Mycobacteroides abscessus subsp. bolletii]SLE13891.1 Uncharacterised protein [Mycobacteroides abscessus subsp. bolletii]
MPDPLFTAAQLLESHGYAVVELPKPVGVNGMAASDMWHQAPGSFVGTALVSQWERSNA